MVKYKMVPDILKMMANLEQVRNIGIIAHVDHGKTTTSDTLLAAAGIISQKVAGEALATDYLEVEQKRGITVKAANVSLYHEVEGKPYVINLIDTPGHVDFTGKVTRSLRVLDGAIVVVDAVEGIMTQTETVLRQALEERVRPLLFINKVDRLIKELKYTPNQIQQRFVEIIKEVNKLIASQAEPEFRDKWLLDPAKGQVAFGSAKEKWGFTIPASIKTGLKLSDVIDAYNRGKDAVEELSRRVPIAEALLDMAIKFIPNPREAQKYRIPKIWKGDINSPIGKAMMEADVNGPTVMLISDMRVDPHAGLVATGRLFSGRMESGKEVWLVNSKIPQRVLQVSLYMGPTREVADVITAGNILAVLGLDKARAGETVVDVAYKDQMAPFEKLHYVSEPVVTVAVEPKNTKDLPKLIESLHRLSIEDPNLVVKINEETGEYLLSGMGPLHLEIALTFLKENYGVEVTTSPPVIVYRESVRTNSDVFEGKSPNKHNKFYLSVEPLNEETIKLIQEGQVTNDQDFRERAKILRDKASWDYDEARRIWLVDENINIFVDKTTGLQYLREVKDTILQGFRLAMKEGPLAAEPVRGIKVILHDAVIHEDPAHRGPAQIYPAVRNAIFAGMLSAKPTILEPIQKLDIRMPMTYLGNVTAVLTKKRGKILTVTEAGDLTRLIAEIPVAESFDLASEIRSATVGKAFWGLEFSRWAPVPDSILPEIIKKIRERKGLPPEPPKISDFLSP
ncbi:MAG TPA: elongation factor EF-2 [Fervidicoccus fontis]|uniref:Elongation factor 2 n=1 Tax=Fervidicoccus fontis TaxID=683846 RepID=A0A7C2UU73_9CREN|nr:MAG: elongation factor EF-2 [Fervidicoccus sp.]HEU97623.1 elongation factor EF-2 [Fervidicoccus fontis]